MKAEQLNDLINKENEDREYEMLRKAKSLIQEITQQQAKITTAQTRIAEIRTELKALEAEQLKATDVLGE